MANAIPSTAAELPKENVGSASDLRERVKNMTSAELAKTIEEMNGPKAMPDIFRETDVQDAIAKRMEEVDVSLDTKEKWESLKGGILKNAITDKAEAAFVKELEEKGGIRLKIGKAILTVLSWLGFKKAKALKESLEKKGYLRTAAEGAKEHPIFTTFLATITGKEAAAFFANNKDAAEYLEQNKDAIETEIRKRAEETGQDVETVTHDLGDRLRDILAKGGDLGIKGLAIGITTVFGGAYDEETGVVTLPHSSMRPSVVIAWQAGKRRRSAFSAIVMEDRLKAIMKQTNIVTKGAREISGHKQKLAARALELMKQGTLRNAPIKESLELERILGVLETDLNLDGTKPIKEAVDYNPADAEKRLQALTDEMERQYKTEVQDFNETKKTVFEKMDSAEKQIAADAGNADSVRKETMNMVRKEMDEYNDTNKKNKLAIGEQLADALSNVEQHAPQLKSAEGPVGKTLEFVAKKAENTGCKIRKVPGGKYVVGAITGYSFLPLALQGMAAMRMGEEGEAAKKAFQNDLIEAGSGFIPVVGEAMDIRAAVMGTDLNGRELSTAQRITSGVMGGLGAVSLALTPFTGGLSVVGFRGLRGLFAARKAAKVAKLADKGITVAGATEDSIKAIRAGEKNLETLQNMAAITKTQQRARHAKNFVQNAQRTMQVATYAHLGWEVCTGVATIYDAGSTVVETGMKKAGAAIDTAEAFVDSKLSFSDEPAGV